MRATRLNHLSVIATDLETSARFYEEVFGLERIPTPNFGFPVIWLRLGEQQLHLFELDEPAPPIPIDIDRLDGITAIFVAPARARGLGADGRHSRPTRHREALTCTAFAPRFH